MVTENYNHILVFLRRGGKAIAYPSLIVIIMILLAGQELSLAAVVQLQPNSAAVLFLITAVSALVPVFFLFLVGKVP